MSLLFSRWHPAGKTFWEEAEMFVRHCLSVSLYHLMNVSVFPSNSATATVAAVSLSNRHQYRWAIKKWTSTLAQDWLKKNATENAYQSISEFLDFKPALLGGAFPPDPPSGSCLRRSKLASSCSEVWLRPCKIENEQIKTVQNNSYG